MVATHSLHGTQNAKVKLVKWFEWVRFECIELIRKLVSLTTQFKIGNRKEYFNFILHGLSCENDSYYASDCVGISNVN